MLVIAFYRKKALVRCSPHSEHLFTWLTCLLVSPSLRCCSVIAPCWLTSSASRSSIRRFVITEKAPTRAFSWFKAATTAFTRSHNMKLGPLRNYHKGRAAIRHHANQTARPL